MSSDEERKRQASISEARGIWASIYGKGGRGWNKVNQENC